MAKFRAHMPRMLTFLTAAAAAFVLTASAPASQNASYWLGTRDGSQLKFVVKVPADAAKLVLKKTAAPGRGADTVPRYKRLVHTIEGRSVVVHMNEVGWDTNGPDSGALTWTVAAGVGAEWMSLSTSSPDFKAFAEALKGLSTEFMPGWWTAKVVVVEGDRPAENFRLNRDGSFGKPSASAEAQAVLEDLTDQSELGDEDIVKVREAFLALANAARTNPNYRKENKASNALNLPSGLKPLVLDDALTSAAQDQADYCAKNLIVTHDQSDPEKSDVGKRVRLAGADGTVYEAAASGSLADCPRVWMVSSTHYRPWWNLDGQVVTKVGFGVRKGSDGSWYYIAVFM